MDEKNKISIGIATFPVSNAGFVPVSNIVDIISSISENIYVITGGVGTTISMYHKECHVYEVKHKKGTNKCRRILNYVTTQIKFSYTLAKMVSDVDLWIFFMDGEGLVLPILTAKLLRKRVVIASAGSGWKVAQIRGDSLARVLSLLQNITYHLADKIILHSEGLIEEHGLQKYRGKISIAHEYFLDFSSFKTTKKFDERADLVGYIGRLSEEKGIQNFVKAIPLILEARKEIKFLIGGDGQLRDEIKKYVDEVRLNNEVKLTGWIQHSELPDYLNELKLLVIPSDTESGPIVAMEAMACSVPILATRVGHILNIIEDMETGFSMMSNSPECIAENVIRALECTDPERIVKNAKALVERKFTREAAVKRYGAILREIHD